MERTFPAPSAATADTRRLFLTYLDYYRSTIAEKLSGMAEADLRRSRLPSGWTPIELLKHLVFMERRWLVWGFAAEPVEAPGATVARAIGGVWPTASRCRTWSRHSIAAGRVLARSSRAPTWTRWGESAGGSDPTRRLRR